MEVIKFYQEDVLSIIIKNSCINISLLMFRSIFNALKEMYQVFLFTKSVDANNSGKSVAVSFSIQACGQITAVRSGSLLSPRMFCFANLDFRKGTPK
jgi:hypothetical protein